MRDANNQKGSLMLADRQFVSRLKEQTEQAILALVDSYYAPIYRYLCRLLNDEQAAAELTQETFLNAYIALPRLEPDSNLSAWLYRIATNLARKYHRRRRLAQWLPLNQFHSHQRNHEDQIVEQDLVSQALTQLSADYRTCLLLQIWSGLSCAEIAQVVGKSEDAVKVLLMRARRRFREAYEALSSDGED